MAFYPLKPTNLEPRRPKLENNDTANVCGANETLFEEVYSCNATCEFRNHSPEKPGWKGKEGGGVQKRKRKVTGENKTAGNELGSFSKTNFTYIFKRPLASALTKVSD